MVSSIQHIALVALFCLHTHTVYADIFYSKARSLSWSSFLDGEKTLSQGCLPPLIKCQDGTCKRSKEECLKTQIDAEKAVCIASGKTYCWAKKSCVETAADCTSEKEACILTRMKWCPREEKCIEPSLPCISIQECPKETPFRCHDFSCATEKALCQDVSIMPIVCAEGERMCFDGSCYSKREYLQKCTVPYNGCGPGYIECNTTFDSGVCRKSITECEREYGCGKDEKLCGWERTSDGSMYSSKKSAVRKRICKKRCYFTQAMKPETKAQEVDTTASDTVIDLMTNDREGAAKRRSVRMRVKKGMLRRKTNFTFVDVPDSVRFSEKVVKKFGERVKAPMITIEPSEEVDFSQPGGIELEFPVLDEAAQESSVVCNALLLKLRAYKIDNILNATEDWAEMGRCKPARWSGEAECICKVNVTHFSTFAVAEEDELCGDNVPDGSCAVGEFFNAGTSACENCTVGKTSCGGGVGEDGCRCAEGGGFNGSVVGSTVIQHVEGNTECTISDEHCYPDENDAGAIADMEWLSDQYLLSLHLNTHVIYRHDTSVYPHTKTLLLNQGCRYLQHGRNFGLSFWKLSKNG